MKNINKICKLVVKITGEEIHEAMQMSEDQIAYLHPLKIATQRKYNEMGRNNKMIVEKLKDLRDTIKLNEEPSKS